MMFGRFNPALPDERPVQGRAVLGRLLGYLQPFRNQLLAVLALVLIGATSQALGPLLIGQAIDGAISQGDRPALDRTVLLLLLVYVVGMLATRQQIITIGIIGQRTLAQLRADIFATVQRLSLSFFDRQPAGDLMSRLVNDTDVLNQLFSQGIVQMVGSLFGLAGILIAMLALDWRLALASFVVIPLLLLLTRLFAGLSRRAFRRTRQSIGAVSTEIQEEIAGVRVAQAFNRTQTNLAEFTRRNAANRDANVSATAVTSAFTPAVDVLSTVAIAIVAGYGGYLALHRLATVGVVVAFLTYVQQFFRPIQQISSFYTTAQAALAAAERVFELTDTPTELTDAPDAQPLPPIVGRVVFDHVSFSYAARPTAQPPAGHQPPHATAQPAAPTLHDISLVAEPGQTVAVVGPTGAGKTTLINLLARFYDVSAGAVTIDGHDLRSVTRISLRAQLGLVLQDSFLFSGTVSENIRYGRLDASDDEVVAAAQAAHAHAFITRLPEGYASQVGERGSALSQGQRQLIGIARALLANPRLLILDEATSSVDSRTELLIQQALETLLRGRTAFVIAHRLSTIREADQVLVMQHGQIIERGTHTELLERDGFYTTLYRRQFREASGPAPHPHA